MLGWRGAGARVVAVMTSGRKRNDALDRYDTPPEVTQAFLAAWKPEHSGDWMSSVILEPAAGAGAMLGPLAERFREAQLAALDINPRAEGIAADDFLRPRFTAQFDLVFTNPPYNQAMEFAVQGLNVTRHGGYVVLLLRLAFLESQKRASWLRENMPESVWVLSKRPSFDGKGTDSAAYAWFVWRKGQHPTMFEGHLI